MCLDNLEDIFLYWWQCCWIVWKGKAFPDFPFFDISFLRLIGSLAQVPPWCPPNSGEANIRCPPRMIYLRSRLGRAMLAIGKGGLPGPHSTSPGSQPLQFSFSQAATLETLPWGIFNATCISLARSLWGEDKGVEPTGLGIPLGAHLDLLNIRPSASESPGNQDELQLASSLLYAALDYLLLCIVPPRFVQASVRVDYLLWASALRRPLGRPA